VTVVLVITPPETKQALVRIFAQKQVYKNK
jgi:hypothetical protein